jgi:hypothetical protein
MVDADFLSPKLFTSESVAATLETFLNILSIDSLLTVASLSMTTKELSEANKVGSFKTSEDWFS